MKNVVDWLLGQDISIRFLTHRDVLDAEPLMLKQLQEKIPEEGFGAAFLSCQKDQGHWGLYYYQPKWTSTHYTLLDLKNLGSPQDLKPCREIVRRMFEQCQLQSGGMNLSKYPHPSDTCVDGMVLNYAAYFSPDEPRIIGLAAHLLTEQKEDGGFTWEIHGDQGGPHSTLCVLEGLKEFRKAFPMEHPLEMDKAIEKGIHFLFSKNLFFGDPDHRFRRLSYPYRYRYDLLRVLECFADLKVPCQEQLLPALEWLKGKRNRDGRWALENQHKGKVHFPLGRVGVPDPFITQKALYVLKSFQVPW